MDVLGIDIAKLKFDVALIRGDKFRTKAFDNTPDGFASLMQWLHEHDVVLAHACMEATGVYWQALAEHLRDAGFDVSVVNPAAIALYAKAQLARNKTDKEDAKVIARYCQRERPALWRALPPEQQKLLNLVRQLAHLQRCEQAEQNRLGTADAVVAGSIKATIAFLQAEIKRCEERIKDHINGHPQLKSNQDLLTSIPGIGEKTAAWLLAYLGDGSRFQRGKQAACYAGLSPRLHQSGSSVNGRSVISKAGQVDLRKILFMPALATYGRGYGYQAFVQRLKDAGKAPKAIVIALMRKMLTIAQAVLKSQKPFDASLHAA